MAEESHSPTSFCHGWSQSEPNPGSLGSCSPSQLELLPALLLLCGRCQQLLVRSAQPASQPCLHWAQPRTAEPVRDFAQERLGVCAGDLFITSLVSPVCSVVTVPDTLPFLPRFPYANAFLSPARGC